MVILKPESLSSVPTNFPIHLSPVILLLPDPLLPCPPVPDQEQGPGGVSHHQLQACLGEVVASCGQAAYV